MTDKTTLDWKEGMAFDASLEGATIRLDAAERFGGRGYGPKPKGLVLSALAGCTAMDVVSILGKMRSSFDGLTVDVDGHSVDEHPKVYDRIHMTFRFTGDALDEAKIRRAIELSETRYCAVWSMLAATAEITYELHLNA